MRPDKFTAKRLQEALSDAQSLGDRQVITTYMEPIHLLSGVPAAAERIGGTATAAHRPVPIPD